MPTVASLYAQHAPRVLRWVRRFAVPEPEELVHEIFVRVLERIDTFRAESSPTTWLYRLTTNACLNHLRDTGRRAELWREHIDGALWTTPTPAADQEVVASFRQLWHRLDDELVEVGVYYFVDAMTHAEIARIVGCSERTVGNRLERLREAALDAAGGAP